MIKSPSYQIEDSTKTELVNHNQDSVLGIELLEEVDEDVVVPKQYKPQRIKHEKLDSTLTKMDSAYYGIRNEVDIPTRGFQIKEAIQETTEILFEPSHKVNHVSIWQIGILLFSVLLLGFAKAFSVNRFKQVVKSIFSYRISTEIIREEKVFYHRVNLLLTTIHICITSLFIYQLGFLIKASFHESITFIFYLKILAFLLVLYVLKYFFARMLAIVFNQQALASEYIFNVSLYNNFQGVLFIPILLILYFTTFNFSSILMYIALPVLGLGLLLRLFRLVMIGNAKSISYFYIFLYICTLEILPLVVIFKIFILV
jgi:Domain of unknown function (DUF4271)